MAVTTVAEKARELAAGSGQVGPEPAGVRAAQAV